jgi:leucyl-tRNA synthetase
MPQWAGSSWYFLRYPDPSNDKVLADPELLKKWLPVDYYVGGVEHAVLHLLYARFYTKFLHDIGVVDFEEPFTKLFNQGMITNQGRKMDKSGGNGVSPDDIVNSYGCDTLRIYELFVGPPELDSEWDERSIEGVSRFLNKVWRLVDANAQNPSKVAKEIERLRHKLIHDVTTRLNNWSLNTVVSAFMEYTNKITEQAGKAGIDKQTLETVTILLAPFAPHVAEEFWEKLGHSDSVFSQAWPKADPEKMKDDTITIVVQIGGKLRDTIIVSREATKEDAIAAAKEALGARLSGEIVKEIYVPGRIVNFVVK